MGGKTEQNTPFDFFPN